MAADAAPHSLARLDVVLRCAGSCAALRRTVLRCRVFVDQRNVT